MRACCSGIHPDRKLVTVLRCSLETAFFVRYASSPWSFKGFDKGLNHWRYFFKFLSGGMFSFQNHSRRTDFRVNVSFRITTCFTLYTLWKPRILSKHAIFADASQKRTDKVMIFMEFWHFPISQKRPLAIPQLFIAKKCREFFASSVGFELGGFKRNSGRMLKVTCSWSAPSNRIFRVPLAVLVKVTWAPCWRSLRSDPNPFRGILLGCP